MMCGRITFDIAESFLRLKNVSVVRKNVAPTANKLFRAKLPSQDYCCHEFGFVFNAFLFVMNMCCLSR